ncbi:MAG: hypothetical protein D6722_18460 [Bacteroidetes bacterium]|nr:MAG: hypothetical protein D6722_18460 [Bacteroidota bacterium]
MSVEIILSIIGAALILVALFVGPKWKVPSGILGLVLLMYGAYSVGTVTMPGQIEQVAQGNKLEVTYPVERIQIISPLAGDSVECRILTMGVYPDAHDKDIWVLLKPSDNKYYPQSDHTNTSFKRNGEWQVITRFGGDEGERYDIIVYETDAEASQFFIGTIESWKEALSYPGLQLEELPAGAREVDRITVFLQENCRGVF